MTPLRDRIETVREAARALADTDTLLRLTVEALSAACSRGIALAFTRGAGTDVGRVAVMAEGQHLASGRNTIPHPGWIVDIDHVPEWQQDRWIEPMIQGIHGENYFANSRLTLAFGGRAPEYGRAMICAHGRMLAWTGAFVDARWPFHGAERARLAAACAQMAEPLRVSTLLSQKSQGTVLTARQRTILSGVARGWTNKQIARELDISASTVKTILERLYRRSGRTNRAALIALLHAP